MMKLGLLGPEGTFSEIAARKWDAKAELVFLDDNELVARAVDDGLCDESIVPIENSVEGPVGVVHDQLLKNKSHIIGEVIVPIRQCLLSRGKPSEIKVILSHPRRWASAGSISESTTRKPRFARPAARPTQRSWRRSSPRWLPSGRRRPRIATDCTSSQKASRTRTRTYTRFIVIGKKTPAPTGHDKTSMAVYLDRDRPGALYEFLGEFARRKINMTRIESRPSRLTLGDYWFFIDVEGHRQDKSMKEAIAALEKESGELKVLGSYPRASIT